MLDEKFIPGVLKLQISVSFRGLRPLHPGQGFGLGPLGAYSAPKPSAIKLQRPWTVQSLVISGGG